MGEWECEAGAGYTIVMTPELWTRDKVFEVLSRIPMSPEDWEDHWSTKNTMRTGKRCSSNKRLPASLLHKGAS